MDCVIMKDKTTNQSRGFGFVKFKDPNCVGTVLASRPHTLDGRNVSAGPRRKLSVLLCVVPGRASVPKLWCVCVEDCFPVGLV